MKFFKKVNPRQALYMSDGAPLQFEDIDRDTGIYPPEGKGMSEAVQKQIEACIAGQRGGVSEIPETEYRELIQKKKSTPSRKTWREEWSLGSLPDTVGLPNGNLSQDPRQPHAAVAAAKPVAVAEPPKATKR